MDCRTLPGRQKKPPDYLLLESEIVVVVGNRSIRSPTSQFFCHGVVKAIFDGSYGYFHDRLDPSLSKFLRRVLRTMIGIKNDLLGTQQRANHHLQGSHLKLRVSLRGQGPTHDTGGKDFVNRRKIQGSFRFRYVCRFGHPKLIRSLSMKAPMNSSRYQNDGYSPLGLAITTTTTETS